jgi:hypothetical protein
MPAQEPQVDLTKINFPTDRLSIKRLRERCPNDFDAADDRVKFFGTALGDDLTATLQLERTIARMTFDVAMGRTSANWVNDYDFDPREIVAQSLIEYGLATGPHHAQQQVRDIEAQAVAQAKGFGPLPQTRTQAQSK